MGDLNPGVVNVGVYVGMCMCNGRPDPVTCKTAVYRRIEALQHAGRRGRHAVAHPRLYHRHRFQHAQAPAPGGRG